MCKVEPGKKPSMFYNLEFIYFDKECRPQYRESKRMRARHDKIFDMEYLYTDPPRESLHQCGYLYEGKKSQVLQFFGIRSNKDKR